MAQLSLGAEIRYWIGEIAFAVFLLSQSLTADEYFDLLERDAQLRIGADDAGHSEACPASNHETYKEGTDYNFCPECGERLLS